jgi:hypothetical protein
VRKHGGKYQAKIKVNCNRRLLGTFATPEEAALCYARHVGAERAAAEPGEEDGDEGEEAAASKARNLVSMAHHKAEIDKLEQQQLPQGMSPVRDSSAPPNGSGLSRAIRLRLKSRQARTRRLCGCQPR